MYISSNMSYDTSSLNTCDFILIVFGKNIPKVTYFIHGPELRLWPSGIFFCKLGMPLGTRGLFALLNKQSPADCYAFELVFLNIMLSVITDQCRHVPVSFGSCHHLILKTLLWDMNQRVTITRLLCQLAQMRSSPTRTVEFVTAFTGSLISSINCELSARNKKAEIWPMGLPWSSGWKSAC